MSRKDIRSLHVIGTKILGGAERFLARLVNAFQQDGYRSLVMVRPGSPLPDLLLPEVPVERVAMRNGADLMSMVRIRRMTAKLRPQAVQTYMGRATRLTRLPRRGGAVHVARLGGYYRLASYRHADALVGNTQGICDYLLRQGVPADRVFKIGNFVDRPESKPGSTRTHVRREVDVPADAWLVFALGRFVAKKGFASLLNAFAELPASVDGRPLHLMLAGEGPLTGSLRQQAQRLDVERRIHWPGWVADPGSLFMAADVFVCPSLDEPLGNVVLEAWSRSVPVVATRTAGPLELISPDRDGVLVEPGNADALAAAILRVVASPPEFREGLALAGLQTLETSHSPEAVVRAYRDLYETLHRRNAP